MPEKIVITRPVMLGALLLLAGTGLLVLARMIPDIQREIKIWTM
jgi:hypothetical protein